MGEQRAFKGVWIPAEVWLSDELTIYEKAVFAEIDSLDGENHCWASNEYLAKFCKMSEVTISRSISKLIQLGFIEKLSFDGRQRVLAVNKNISQTRETYLQDKSELSTSENLLLIENKKENSLKSTLTGAPLKHPRNFSKEKLTDDLESGKDIDAQKKEKKKLSNFEKCLEEINSRHFTESEKELLKRHLEWSYNSKDAKRIKDRVSIKSKLDFLEQRKAKGDDLIKIIQQSIDRCWHAFYEYSDNSKGSTSNHECFADSVIVNEKSREEQLADLARNKELYGEY